MTRGESVICVSNSVKDYVLKNYPDIPAAKLNVIHRGVSPDQFPYDYTPPEEWLKTWTSAYPQLEGKYVITLPGRITRWKGQIDFIKAIAQLKSLGIPAYGLIVGEPHPKKMEFFEEVKQLIDSKGLNEDISLVGHRSDLREVMAISDVVVSCSTDAEAFGRVTLEALAIGKPVMGYDHGGVHEQLEAILPEGRVDVGDYNMIAKKLKTWYFQKPLVEKTSAFSLAEMLDKTISCYNSLQSSNGK